MPGANASAEPPRTWTGRSAIIAPSGDHTRTFPVNDVVAISPFADVTTVVTLPVWAAFVHTTASAGSVRQPGDVDHGELAVVLGDGQATASAVNAARQREAVGAGVGTKEFSGREAVDPDRVVG